MECPKCRERLRNERYRENDYLLCFYCEGIWLPKKDTGSVTFSHFKVQHRKETSYGCPSCVTNLLSEIEVFDEKIEYCNNCEGIFIDKGEAERMYPKLKDIDDEKLGEDALKALVVLDALFLGLVSVFSLGR